MKKYHEKAKTKNTLFNRREIENKLIRRKFLRKKEEILAFRRIQLFFPPFLKNTIFNFEIYNNNYSKGVITHLFSMKMNENFLKTTHLIDSIMFIHSEIVFINQMK